MTHFFCGSRWWLLRKLSCWWHFTDALTYTCLMPFSSRSENSQSTTDIENWSDAQADADADADAICHLVIFDIGCPGKSSKIDKFQFFGDFCHCAISSYLTLNALVNRQISLKIDEHMDVIDSSNHHGIHGFTDVNVISIRRMMKKWLTKWN